jgi:hypothetical protein
MVIRPDPEPVRLTDLMDNAAEYIRQMETDERRWDVALALQEYICGFMRDVPLDDNQRRQIAVFMVDSTYRFAATIDEYTPKVARAYFQIVMGQFWDAVGSRGARVFYILDYELSNERFEVSRSFLEWSGFSVIAPYSDGFDADALDRVAQLQICGGRHIAYIEKDATVNLINAAKAIGRESGYTAVFRNRGPMDPRVEIVGHGTPPN